LIFLVGEKRRKGNCYVDKNKIKNNVSKELRTKITQRKRMKYEK